MRNLLCFIFALIPGILFGEITHWSVVRDENIAWRTVLPEGGQSAVTIHGDRVFTTMHRPIEAGEPLTEPNVIGLCLDANSGEILWQVTLPGTDPVQMAGIFSDATTFAPIAEGERVWFFNRCGSMGCFEIATGKQIWLREFTPRPRHTNRQCEPILVGDLILTVEVKDKAAGQKLKRHKPAPEGIDPKAVWTYLHGIDKHTGEIRWVGQAGTAVHNTPVLGKTKDGVLAVAHGRGGGHGPLEKPYGVTLTRASDGQPIWSIDLGKCESSFQAHWDEKHVFWWRGKEHLVLDSLSGEVLRTQDVCSNVDFCRYHPNVKAWTSDEAVSVKSGKRMPLTNQTNIVHQDWHYFLAHDIYALGRVNIHSGKTEYLQLPAQLVASAESRDLDQRIWEKKNLIPNDTKNSRGIDIATDKRAKGSGWGHVSAAMPTLVGSNLFIPVMNGTVYVINAEAPTLDGFAIIAINDLGPAGETWTLSHFTKNADQSRVYIRTMKEVICIGK